MPSASAPSDGIAHPVAQQLDAYNRRDIDDFMRWWAEDRRYHAFPDTLLADGAAAIRARHVERFREPDLHGTLRSRVVVGSLVVDHETVRRTFTDGPGEIDVICIYKIRDWLIARAWFQQGEPRLHRADAGALRPG